MAEVVNKEKLITAFMETEEGKRQSEKMKELVEKKYDKETLEALREIS